MAVHSTLGVSSWSGRRGGVMITQVGVLFVGVFPLGAIAVMIELSIPEG
jgi:hypothetical protein